MLATTAESFDCEGYTKGENKRVRQLNRFWEFFMQYSDKMAKGNISVDDLREILKKEYDVNVKIQ